MGMHEKLRHSILRAAGSPVAGAEGSRASGRGLTEGTRDTVQASTLDGAGLVHTTLSQGGT